MISLIDEVAYYDLRDWLWSEAINTFDVIAENDKVQELMCLLEELFPEPVDITTINDLLWFESDWIYEQLGIDIYLEEDNEMQLTMRM